MAAPRIPFVLIGDAPCQPTGLSRIATDLASRLHAEREELGIDLLHVGAINWGPLPLTGVPLTIEGAPWKTWVYPAIAVDREAPVWTAIREYFGNTQVGVLFAVQDPSRSYGLLGKWYDWKRWGYFLVDGTPPSDKLTGPAGEAIRQFDRVLAYGAYGARVLERSGARGPGGVTPHLPHGIDRTIWHNLSMEKADWAATRSRLDPTGSTDQIIGCVATNVARKDLALFLDVIGLLRAQGHQVRGWLHTDQEIGDWSIPQLAADAGLDWKGLTVTLPPLKDAELAAMYATCALTIAPGRGEGFGYPILESLAVGVPVLHVDYAGGADLIRSYKLMQLNPFVYVRTGLYGITRPCLGASHVAVRAATWLKRHYVRENIAAMADPYDWLTLWPQWRAWFLSGLEALRG